MPPTKKSVVVPFDLGINQSVDGFAVSQSDRVAQNVVVKKNGTVESGYVLEQVEYLGDGPYYGVVEANGSPVAMGYPGVVRMDDGEVIDTGVSPSVEISVQPVIQRTRWPSNAHSACIERDGVATYCIVYQDHSTGVSYIRIQRDGELPYIDRPVIADITDGTCSFPRVVVVEDPDVWSSESDGKVFVVVCGVVPSPGLSWRTYSPTDGQLINIGTFGNTFTASNYMQVASRLDDVYVVAKSGSGWYSMRLNWSSTSTASTTTNSLSTVIASGEWPLQIYPSTYNNERTIYGLASNGIIWRSRVGTPLISTYDHGLGPIHVGCIGHQSDGRIVCVQSKFERVGGLTTMSCSRPVFGDLEHYDTPPGTPSDYEKRFNSTIIWVNASDMTLSGTDVMYGAAPCSNMFVHPDGDGTVLSVVVNTAFPLASPDVRASSTSWIASRETPIALTRVAPDLSQANYPGASSTVPLGDGEVDTGGGATVTATWPAGSIMGAKINLTPATARFTLGPVGDFFRNEGDPLQVNNTILNAIRDSVSKGRKIQGWPEITMQQWSVSGASLQERNGQARYWGVNDHGTSNWAEADARCVLVELYQPQNFGITSSAGNPCRVLGILPFTPFHRHLAATSTNIVPPGHLDPDSGSYLTSSSAFPSGYFQSSFVDDIGAFAQLPLVGISGSSMCYPMVHSASPSNGADVSLISMSSGATVSQLPTARRSTIASSAGVLSVGSSIVSPASIQPPHVICLGEAEALAGATSYKVNNVDQRASSNADVVVAGMFYVRYRWSTEDGKAVSALSPPLYAVTRNCTTTQSFVAAASASGLNSVNPTNYRFTSERLSRTDHAFHTFSADTSGYPAITYSYWRRPVLVNAPLFGVDDVELDVFVDPWLAQWESATSGSTNFSGASYPLKITGVPTGHPAYIGTVKPTIDADGRLKFYVGVVNGGSNELTSIAPLSSSTIAEEALEPRPYQVPAIKAAFGYNNRAIVLGCDDVLYYSKNIIGTPEFSDELVIKPPVGAGKITCATAFEEQLILLCEDRIYRLTGQLPDNGDSQSLEWSLISSNSGCNNQASVANTSIGLVFQNANGIHLMTPGGDVQFVGYAVRDDVDSPCVAVSNVPGEPSVAFFFVDKILVLHIETRKWTKLDVGGNEIVGARLINEQLWVLCNSIENVPGMYSMRLVQSSSGTVAVMGDEIVSTGWVSVAGANGYQRVNRVTVFGSLKSAPSDPVLATVKTFVNNRSTPDSSYTFTVNDVVDGDNNFRLVTYPITQKCSSIKVEVSVSGISEPSQEGATTGPVVRPGVVYYGVNLDMVDKGTSFRPVSSGSKG